MYDNQSAAMRAAVDIAEWEDNHLDMLQQVIDLLSANAGVFDLQDYSIFSGSVYKAVMTLHNGLLDKGVEHQLVDQFLLEHLTFFAELFILGFITGSQNEDFLSFMGDTRIRGGRIS